MDRTVEKRRHEILNSSIWKVLLLVGLPVVINQLIVAVYNLFDTYFSSLVGTTEMSATIFVTPVSNTVNAVALGIGIAGTTLVAKYIGLEDYERAKKTIGNMLSIVMVVVVGIVVTFYFYSNEILYAASLRGEALELAGGYFKVILFATPFLFLNNVHMSLFRARGNTSRVLVINGMSVLVKLGLNVLFVVYLKQGILGIAYSTIISRVFVSVFAVYDIFIKENVLKIHAKDLVIEKQVWIPLVVLAIPIITERSVQSFGHVLVSGFANNFGEEVLSAYGITNRLNSLAFTSVAGIGVAVVSLISQNLAIKNYGRIREIVRKSFIAGFFVSIVFVSIVFLVSRSYARVISAGNEVVFTHTMQAINIYAISVIPFGVIQIMNGIYQGFKKTHYTMVVALMRLWVFRVLLIYLLIQFTSLNEYSIWYGMLISNTLAAILSIIIFYADRDIQFMMKNKERTHEEISYTD